MFKFLPRSTTPGMHGRRRLALKAAPLVIGISLMAPLAVTSPASASHVRSVRTAAVVVHTSTFCTEAAQIAKSNPVTNAGTAETSIANTYKNLKAVEPKILAILPSKIKPQYEALFTYFNSFYSVFAKANYDFTKIPPASLGNLAKASAKISADAKAITAYTKAACGIKIGS